jgi:hypothetical protein
MERLPEIVEVKVPELVNKRLELVLGDAPVDCTDNVPLIVVSPPKEKLED